ncbi:MAG: hypothetical protein AAFX09_12880 [Pseudomonadota bacterium]
MLTSLIIMNFYIILIILIFVAALCVARRSFVFAPIVLLATIFATSVFSLFITAELISRHPSLAGMLGALEEVIRCSLLLVLVAGPYLQRAVIGCAALYGFVESLRFKWGELGYLLQERFSAEALSEVSRFRDLSGITVFTDAAAIISTFFVHFSWLCIGLLLFRRRVLGIFIASVLHFSVNTFVVAAQVNGMASSNYFAITFGFMLWSLVMVYGLTRVAPRTFQ